MSGKREQVKNELMALVRARLVQINFYSHLKPCLAFFFVAKVVLGHGLCVHELGYNLRSTQA